jgi:hypothetical protein
MLMKSPARGDSFANERGDGSYNGSGRAVVDIDPEDVATALARGWLPVSAADLSPTPTKAST